MSSRNVVRTIARGSAHHARPASKGVWVGSGIAPGGLIPSSTMWSTVALSLTLSRRRDPSTVAEGVWLPDGDGVAHVDPTPGKDRRFRGDGY